MSRDILSALDEAKISVASASFRDRGVPHIAVKRAD
jgi:hypothetical protein